MMDIGFSNGAIANLCAIAMLGIAAFGGLRKLRRENEADVRALATQQEAVSQKRHDENRETLNELKVSVGERVARLEGQTADFLPRAEIEGKIEHERLNRLQLQKDMMLQLEKQGDAINDLKVKLGGLGQRQDSHDAQMAEIKAIVREGFDKVEIKLDRLAGREGRA